MTGLNIPTDSILLGPVPHSASITLSRPGDCAGFTVLGKRSTHFQRACNGPALSARTKSLMPWLANTFWQLLLSLVVLLQALLNRSIIAQLLSAKALRISSAGLLLLWRAHVTLCQGARISVSNAWPGRGKAVRCTL